MSQTSIAFENVEVVNVVKGGTTYSCSAVVLNGTTIWPTSYRFTSCKLFAEKDSDTGRLTGVLRIQVVGNGIYSTGDWVVKYKMSQKLYNSTWQSCWDGFKTFTDSMKSTGNISVDTGLTIIGSTLYRIDSLQVFESDGSTKRSSILSYTMTEPLGIEVHRLEPVNLMVEDTINTRTYIGPSGPCLFMELEVEASIFSDGYTNLLDDKEPAEYLITLSGSPTGQHVGTYTTTATLNRPWYYWAATGKYKYPEASYTGGWPGGSSDPWTVTSVISAASSSILYNNCWAYIYNSPGGKLWFVVSFHNKTVEKAVQSSTATESQIKNYNREKNAMYGDWFDITITSYTIGTGNSKITGSIPKQTCTINSYGHAVVKLSNSYDSTAYFTAVISGDNITSTYTLSDWGYDDVMSDPEIIIET